LSAPYAVEGSVPLDEAGFGLSVAPIVVVLMVTVAAALAVSYGDAAGKKGWLVVGAALFAPALVFALHAGARLESSRRAGGFAAAAVLVIVFVAVIVISSSWWSAKADGPTGRFDLIATDPSAHVYLRGEPKGPELTGTKAPSALAVEKTYTFSCSKAADDSTVWLQLAGTQYWAPASVLRPVGKVTVARLPAC